MCYYYTDPFFPFIYEHLFAARQLAKYWVPNKILHFKHKLCSSAFFQHCLRHQRFANTNAEVCHTNTSSHPAGCEVSGYLSLPVFDLDFCIIDFVCGATLIVKCPNMFSQRALLLRQSAGISGAVPLQLLSTLELIWKKKQKTLWILNI